MLTNKYVYVYVYLKQSQTQTDRLSQLPLEGIFEINAEKKSKSRFSFLFPNIKGRNVEKKIKKN